MKIDPNNLLKALGSGLKPPGTTGGAPAPGIEQMSFADLLKQVRDGTLQSKIPVTIDPNSGVRLSDDQLARLSLAADKAEASGIRTALVMLGDQRVILDVHQRTVIGAASADAGVLAGVDGVIDLGSGTVTGSKSPATGEAAKSLSSLLSGLKNGNGTLSPPSASLSGNPKITKLLAELEGHG